MQYSLMYVEVVESYQKHHKPMVPSYLHLYVLPAYYVSFSVRGTEEGSVVVDMSPSISVDMPVDWGCLRGVSKGDVPYSRSGSVGY